MTGILWEITGVEMVKHFNVAHTNTYLIVFNVDS